MQVRGRTGDMQEPYLTPFHKRVGRREAIYYSKKIKDAKETVGGKGNTVRRG